MVQYNRLISDTAVVTYLKQLEQKINGQATKGSGDIIITDPNTGVETIIGTLPDGSTGLQEFVGDIEPPPIATTPIVSAQPGNYVVSWDGQFMGAAIKPRDFVHLNVLAHHIVSGSVVQTVPVGVIRNSNESVLVSTDVALGGETWEFSFASEDYNGNISVQSAHSAPLMQIDAISVVSEAWTDLNTEVSNAQTAASNAQTTADNASIAAQDAADDALAAAGIANSKGKVLTQSTTPTVADQNANTLWIDTTAGANTPKRWNGSAWVAVTDKVATDAAAAVIVAQNKADQAFNNAAAAATAAGTAQTTADGKNRNWYQDNAPAGTAHKLGDVWFDTNDGNRIYLWSGSPTPAWTSFQDAAIGAAASTATTALNTANGKNKFIWSTSPASGTTGYVAGDIWFQRDANNNVIGQWEFTTSWQSRKLDDAVIANLNAGKLTAGFIDAARIAAGSLTADKVIISRGANLLTDPEIKDLTGWSDGFAQATGGMSGNGSILIPTSTTQDGTYYGMGSLAPARGIRVVSGSTYRIGAWVRSDQAIPIAGVKIYFRLYDAAGAFTFASDVVNNVPENTSIIPANTWTWISGMVKVPDGNVKPFGVFGLYKQASFTTGAVRWSDPSVQQASGGELIVDGSIKTQHMLAGTIDAAVLSAGSITTPKLAAKSIGVDKLMVTSTDNLLMEGDFSNNGTSWQLSANKYISATAGRSGMPAMRFTGLAGTITTLNLNNKISISPDSRFRGSMWLKSSVDAPANVFKVVGRFYYNATQYTDILLSSNVALLANTWTLVDGIVPATIPSDTIAAQFYISITNALATDIVDVDFAAVTRAADGKLIVDGSITANKLETDLVLATKIIAGSPNDTHAQMDSDGFRVFAKGLDDIVYETVSMGVTSTNDLFSLTNAEGTRTINMDSDGSITALSVEAANSFYYKGDELGEVIGSRPRGMAAWGQVPVNTSQMSVNPGVEVGLFEIAWDTTQDNPARMYEFVVNEFLVQMNGAGTCGIRLRYTTDGTAPSVTSQLIQYNYQQTYTAGFTTLGVSRIIGSNNGDYIRVLVCLYAAGAGATVYGGNGALYTRVMDLGQSMDATAVATTAGGTPAAGGSTSSPVVAKVTKTVEYGYTSVKSYLPSNSQYVYNVAKGYQGLSPAGYGNLRSIYGFNQNFQSILSGATINGIWIYAYFEHWYYNAGGTAIIRLHNNLQAPATYTGVTSNGMSSGSWPKGAGRWVAVPSSLWAGFASGAYKGFALVGDGTYNTYGIANNARIKITYTK